MSCLMMKLESLAALANAVADRLNYGYDFWGFGAPESLYRELKDCRSIHLYRAKDICSRLYRLNARAYNGRYEGHGTPADTTLPDVDTTRYKVHKGPQYREQGFAVCQWHYRLAKLLDFWLYQTEEDATHADPLRSAMAEFRDGLYYFIVQNSSQYVDEPWGG